jgi:CubicO group peptidase (beta-lactamase class C family)
MQAIAGLLLALLLAAPAARAAGCDRPVGKDFAAAGPGDVAMSAARLAEMLDALDAAQHEVRALLVLRDCKLVLERYKDGLGREHNHAVYSVTKSFASTMVGALLYRGKLKSVDVPIASLVAQPGRISDEPWAKAKQVTLKNVMQMSSGLAYKHDPCCHPIYDTREDRLAVALAPEVVAAPGTKFQYSDGDVSMTGAAIASVAGDDLFSFGKSVLFEPMQMSNVDWWFKDRTGRYPGGWGLRLRPMDMLKLGQLYVQEGEWNGTRIFDAAYVKEAVQPGPNKSYGLHWWIGDAGFAGTPYYYANGFKGQRIFVFPAWRLVVALSASVGDDERAMVGTVVRGVIDAQARGADADAAGEALLRAKEKAGFRGQVRVKQENQDSPRR